MVAFRLRQHRCGPRPAFGRCEPWFLGFRTETNEQPGRDKWAPTGKPIAPSADPVFVSIRLWPRLSPGPFLCGARDVRKEGRAYQPASSVGGRISAKSAGRRRKAYAQQ
jgi:hypothetical protein